MNGEFKRQAAGMVGPHPIRTYPPAVTHPAERCRRLLRQRSATRPINSVQSWACAIVVPDLASSSFSELAGGQMGRALTAIGIVALIGAVAWWQTFYGEVQRLLGPTGPLPIECLYSMSSACRVVANAADLFGANSYHPLIFWTACGCLLAGLVMGSRIGGPKRRSRNRIR